MPSSKLCDHRLAAARIAAHRVDGDGIVRRHEAGIDQRPQQRHRRRSDSSRGWRPFAPSGSCRPDRARAPESRRPSRGATRNAVEASSTLGAAAPMLSISATVSLRGLVRQAEDDEVDLLHQRALGAAHPCACRRRCSSPRRRSAARRRSRMPRPVVPASPSTNTVGFVGGAGGLGLAFRLLGVESVMACSFIRLGSLVGQRIVLVLVQGLRPQRDPSIGDLSARRRRPARRAPRRSPRIGRRICAG